MEQKPGITQTEDILNSILPPRCEARAESGLDGGGAEGARARARTNFPQARTTGGSMAAALAGAGAPGGFGAAVGGLRPHLSAEMSMARVIACRRGTWCPGAHKGEARHLLPPIPRTPPYIRPVHGACACRARAVHCAQRSALADAVRSEGLARLSVRCDVVQRPELRSEPRLAPRYARAAGCAAGVLGAAAPCGADSVTIRERVRVGARGGGGEN